MQLEVQLQLKLQRGPLWRWAHFSLGKLLEFVWNKFYGQ